MKNIKLSVLTIAICALLCIIFIHTTHTWQSPERVIQCDIINYYAYLPATFIYKDLNFKFLDNNNEKKNLILWTLTTEDGKRVLKYTMGLSFLYLPFFLIAHLIASLFLTDNGGYSLVYSISLLLSGVFYFLVGLIFLRKILLRYFSEKITSLTLLIIGIGTNLLYYSSKEAAMPHSFLFGLFSIFTYYSIVWHENPEFKTSFILGIVFGLISLIRPTDIIIIFLFLLFKINNLNDLKEKFFFFCNNLKYLTIIFLFPILIWIPQFLYWKIATGSFLFYSYINEKFFFTNPQIINALFSYTKGLFVYCPLVITGFIGIILLYKNKLLKKFLLALIVFNSLNIYIISSWWCWWYGGSFGNRAFIESYSLLTIPIAAFSQYLLERKIFIKILYLLIVLFLIFLQIFQTYQYHYGIITYDTMTKKAYWSVFLRTKVPENYWDILSFYDYDRALLGFYVPFHETIKDFKNVKKIYCDAEEIHPNNSYFLKSNNIKYAFEGTLVRTNEKSFSGKYSIKLDSIKSSGFIFYLPIVHIGEKYLFKVKRYSETKDGLIAIEGLNTNFRMGVTDAKTILNSDWDEINYLLEINNELDNKRIKINCYNYKRQPVYFDDFEIIRVE